ncbi:hypothetical protein D3C76_719810 [compost metagenome]
MLQQLRQRCLEQVFKAVLQGWLTEQAVRPAIGGQDTAAVIEQQHPGPLAVEVVRAGIETQLSVLPGIARDDQAVFQALAHHPHHAQGLRGRQVAVAGHIQYADQAPFGVEQRRGGAGHVAVALEKVLILAHMHRLAAGQGGADGIGTHPLFKPAGAGDKTVLLTRVDKTPGAPGFQELALVIAEHDQVAGIAQQMIELRDHLVTGGAQQDLLAFEQLAQAGSGEVTEVGS